MELRVSAGLLLLMGTNLEETSGRMISNTNLRSRHTSAGPWGDLSTSIGETNQLRGVWTCSVYLPCIQSKDLMLNNAWSMRSHPAFKVQSLRQSVSGVIVLDCSPDCAESGENALVWDSFFFCCIWSISECFSSGQWYIWAIILDFLANHSIARVCTLVKMPAVLLFMRNEKIKKLNIFCNFLYYFCTCALQCSVCAVH